MQKLAAVYFLRNQLKIINNLREKYDPDSFLIPPHITIVSPVSELTEGEFISHIEKVLGDFYSFPVHLCGLMETPDHCLFILVKNGGEQITSLHDNLYTGILQKYIPKDYPFIPHLTLGCFEQNGIYNERLYTDAYEEAVRLDINISAIFDSISIIKGDGIGPIKVLKRIDLSIDKLARIAVPKTLRGQLNLTSGHEEDNKAKSEFQKLLKSVTNKYSRSLRKLAEN